MHAMRAAECMCVLCDRKSKNRVGISDHNRLFVPHGNRQDTDLLFEGVDTDFQFCSPQERCRSLSACPLINYTSHTP